MKHNIHKKRRVLVDPVNLSDCKSTPLVYTTEGPYPLKAIPNGAHILSVSGWPMNFNTVRRPSDKFISIVTEAGYILNVSDTSEFAVYDINLSAVKFKKACHLNENDILAVAKKAFLRSAESNIYNIRIDGAKNSSVGRLLAVLVAAKSILFSKSSTTIELLSSSPVVRDISTIVFNVFPDAKTFINLYDKYVSIRIESNDFLQFAKSTSLMSSEPTMNIFRLGESGRHSYMHTCNEIASHYNSDSCLCVATPFKSAQINAPHYNSDSCFCVDASFESAQIHASIIRYSGGAPIIYNDGSYYVRLLNYKYDSYALTSPTIKFDGSTFYPDPISRLIHWGTCVDMIGISTNAPFIVDGYLVNNQIEVII
jgi:hypothetical protein